VKPEPAKIAGLILSAGESSRMGSDKALLEYEGCPFLERLISIFLRHVSPVIVVLGHHAAAIQMAIPRRPNLDFAINSNYRAGQLSSFQAGIRALPANYDAALLTLVDHPSVRDATIAAMIERFTCSKSPLVIPRFQGRRGHPVLLSRAILDEILSLPQTASAKQVIHGHMEAALQLDMDDPGVLRDVDTPADYESLKIATAEAGLGTTDKPR